MVEDHNKLAALLRRVVSQTIPEDEFWTEFNALSKRIKEPVVQVALESATHYWKLPRADSLTSLSSLIGASSNRVRTS